MGTQGVDTTPLSFIDYNVSICGINIEITRLFFRGNVRLHYAYLLPFW